MLIRIFLMVSIALVLESSANDINLMKTDVDRVFRSGKDAQQEEITVINYCESMNEQKLDSFASLCRQEIDEGLRNDDLNLHKIRLISKAYVLKKFKINNSGLFIEISKLIQEDKKFIEKIVPENIGIIKSDINIVGNYILLHNLLKEYLPLCFESDNSMLGYQLAISIIGNSHINIRKLSADYLRKLVAEKKLKLDDVSSFELMINDARKKEESMTNLENMDDVLFKYLQESIKNDLDTILKMLSE